MYRDLKEVRDRLEELTHASHQDIGLVMKQYFHPIRPESKVGSLLLETIPSTDFNEWFSEALSTRGGMVGSGQLNWPLDTDERVSLQYQLIQAIANEELDLSDVVHDFIYDGPSSNINDCNYAFIIRVIVPFHNDLLRVLEPHIESSENNNDIAQRNTTGGQKIFVDLGRVKELSEISSDKYDLSKLLQLCKELNISYQNDCFLSIASLTRTLIDHVPPVFNFSNFTQVANNYEGTKSFKDSMKHLEKSARAIGDAHLHTQIRKSETLPNSAQINFTNDVDVLLAEILRLLK